jgi:hypothetical protein
MQYYDFWDLAVQKFFLINKRTSHLISSNIEIVNRELKVKREIEVIFSEQKGIPDFIMQPAVFKLFNVIVNFRDLNSEDELINWTQKAVSQLIEREEFFDIDWIIWKFDMESNMIENSKSTEPTFEKIKLHVENNNPFYVTSVGPQNNIGKRLDNVLQQYIDSGVFLDSLWIQEKQCEQFDFYNEYSVFALLKLIYLNRSPKEGNSETDDDISKSFFKFWWKLLVSRNQMAENVLNDRFELCHPRLKHFVNKNNVDYLSIDTQIENSLALFEFRNWEFYILFESNDEAIKFTCQEIRFQTELFDISKMKHNKLGISGHRFDNSLIILVEQMRIINKIGGKEASVEVTHLDIDEMLEKSVSLFISGMPSNIWYSNFGSLYRQLTNLKALFGVETINLCVSAAEYPHKIIRIKIPKLCEEKEDYSLINTSLSETIFGIEFVKRLSLENTVDSEYISFLTIQRSAEEVDMLVPLLINKFRNLQKLDIFISSVDKKVFFKLRTMFGSMPKLDCVCVNDYDNDGEFLWMLIRHQVDTFDYAKY